MPRSKQSNWMLFWISLASLSLLSACQTVNSDACPALVSYSREFQIRMADELAAMPEGAALTEAMADYSVLRQQVRVCR